MRPSRPAEDALSPASHTIVDSGATLDMNGFDNEVNTLSGGGTVEDSASGTSVWLGVGIDRRAAPLLAL